MVNIINSSRGALLAKSYSPNLANNQNFSAVDFVYQLKRGDIKQIKNIKNSKGKPLIDELCNLFSCSKTELISLTHVFSNNSRQPTHKIHKNIQECITFPLSSELKEVLANLYNMPPEFTQFSVKEFCNNLENGNITQLKSIKNSNGKPVIDEFCKLFCNSKKNSKNVQKAVNYINRLVDIKQPNVIKSLIGSKSISAELKQILSEYFNIEEKYLEPIIPPKKQFFNFNKNQDRKLFVRNANDYSNSALPPVKNAQLPPPSTHKTIDKEVFYSMLPQAKINNLPNALKNREPHSNFLEIDNKLPIVGSGGSLINNQPIQSTNSFPRTINTESERLLTSYSPNENEGSTLFFSMKQLSRFDELSPLEFTFNDITHSLENIPTSELFRNRWNSYESISPSYQQAEPVNTRDSIVSTAPSEIKIIRQETKISSFVEIPINNLAAPTNAPSTHAPKKTPLRTKSPFFSGYRDRDRDILALAKTTRKLNGTVISNITQKPIKPLSKPPIIKDKQGNYRVDNIWFEKQYPKAEIQPVFYANQHQYHGFNADDIGAKEVFDDLVKRGLIDKGTTDIYIKNDKYML